MAAVSRHSCGSRWRGLITTRTALSTMVLFLEACFFPSLVFLSAVLVPFQPSGILITSESLSSFFLFSKILFIRWHNIRTPPCHSKAFSKRHTGSLDGMINFYLSSLYHSVTMPLTMFCVIILAGSESLPLWSLSPLPPGGMRRAKPGIHLPLVSSYHKSFGSSSSWWLCESKSSILITSKLMITPPNASPSLRTAASWITVMKVPVTYVHVSTPSQTSSSPLPSDASFCILFNVRLPPKLLYFESPEVLPQVCTPGSQKVAWGSGTSLDLSGAFSNQSIDLRFTNSNLVDFGDSLFVPVRVKLQTVITWSLLSKGTSLETWTNLNLHTYTPKPGRWVTSIHRITLEIAFGAQMTDIPILSS